ncbi:hypothetical protein K8S19_02830 [bacterium]|nr:hypothetical protein [bacterium]
MFKRCLGFVVIYTLICLPYPILADDSTWNLDGFQIRDMPFVETQQFQMNVESSGQISKDQAESGYTDYRDTIFRASDIESDLNTDLGPAIHYSNMTKELEISTNIPLAIAYTHHLNTSYETEHRRMSEDIYGSDYIYI